MLTDMLPGAARSLSNPGPVDAIRQDHAHRAGAPNHLQGSGENPMVGTNTTPAPVTVEAVRERLAAESHRYMITDHRGLSLDMLALVDVIAGIVTEYSDHLTAERDALAEDLAWELNANHTATAPAGGEA